MSNLYDQLMAGNRHAQGSIFAELADGRTFTYGEVEKRSAQFANALRALDVNVGDRVAVQVEKSLDVLMMYLGTLRAGAVFVPLNTAYTGAEMVHFLADAEPSLLVVSEERTGEYVGQTEGNLVRSLDADGGGSLARHADGEATTFATVARSDDDLAAILYTSGTTGRSKGAMLSHGNLFSNADVLQATWQFDRSDVLLHALPVFHTHGLFVATNVTLVAGASMILLPGFDLDAVIAALPRATVMMGVPTFYIRMLSDERLDEELTRTMRLFISGSAPLSADVHRDFRKRTGHEILERYGMTETNMNTSNPYIGRRVPGSVGPALPGTTIRITDPSSGAELERGAVGDIEIRGPNVFKGYWRLPEKTATEFHDGYFVSGDLGYLDEAGYLHIVGRAKDLIIAGGYNIYPAEVEAALDDLPEVGESAVIGVPHPDLGEAVVAVVVPKKARDVNEEAIRSALGERLARFKQPRRVLAVSELPKNAMGKVQKKELRERYASLFDAAP